MGLKDADHADLVVAAQAGDDRAREELIAAYLPLLYNIVGRALSGHADVDDVVQETLLRVVRDLPALRAPESFRSWLVSITLRQINTHWHRQHALADRTTVIDEARRIPDAGAEPVDATILRLHVSDERRRVVEAGRWLDQDHRMLLSLWWQECAGLLSREDMAAATGLTVAHVGVRLQRMREQLELCRTIVAALEADPRCPQLDGTVVGWDGHPASVWRKRIARHTRDCPVCGATSAERVPAELLPLSLTTLAVPAALIAALWTATRADEAGAGSLWLGLGVVLSLLGFVVVGPLLAGGVVRVLGAVVLRVFGPVGRMAERNALRNPRRTGATGAALMIGLALVACLSVVGSSMVASATEELDRSVGADFIVQSANGQPIVPQAEAAVAKAAGLDHITRYKWVDATVTDARGRQERTGLVAADPSYAHDVRRETTAGSLAEAYGPGAMSVGGDYAAKHGVKVGDRLTVAFTGGRQATLRVAAITSDDARIDQGRMSVGLMTAERYVPADRMPKSFLVFGTAKDGQEDAAYASMKAALKPYPQYKVADQADYKQELKDQVGQLLNIVYGLLALAIIVAVLGVVNTLALSVVERTREIGLMRAIGLSRRQLRRMIRLESVVIALFGALLGLGLGMGWGTAAQQLLALEGLGVLDIPWPTIVAVFVGSAFVGLFAALVPAFRAGRMNVLNAIASE